ncbi:putative efflux pump [Botrytis fragariae]|uniref:Putative efflux pump n=1 Tax=Botrytis fragariae TaxID=1964551 RepID=A0A8H6ASG5_9HELO|nr:putative efflux pump [Botrytis fragariae]KAF5872814.1 putative efflux pump [Botrytis fragariae]
MLGRIFYPALLAPPPNLPRPSSLSLPSKMKKLTPSQIATFLLLLSTISSLLLSSTYLPLIERYICSAYTPSSSPLSFSSKEMCKSPPVQSRIAEINGMFQFMSYLPGIFLTEPWGWIAGRWGTRRGVVGLVAGSGVLGGVWWGVVCEFLSRWNSDMWDIRWIYLIPVFDLIGGGKVVMVSLLYTYIGEEANVESGNGVCMFPPLSPASLDLDLPHYVMSCNSQASYIFWNHFLSSTLYRLVALQLFSSFEALSLAGFLLRYEYGVWVICALAVGCRVLSIGIAMLLPSGKVFESNINIQSLERETGMERGRYRDFIDEDQHDHDSETSLTSTNHNNSTISPPININSFPSHPKPNSHINPATAFLSIVFLVTFSLKIHILYPQFTSLSQNLPYNVTTTIYSFCLLGSSILQIFLPRIIKLMNQERKLRVLFIHNEEGDEAEIEEREGMENNEENDFPVLKWSLLANTMSLILLALPTTRGAVFWLAIGGSVAGSPVQVALLAWGSGLVSDSGSEDSDDFEEENNLRERGYITTARCVLQDLEPEVGEINYKGKRSGRSAIEKYYMRMGILEQVGACLGTGVWSLGFAKGMGGNDRFVDFSRWDLKGWMDEKGGFVLAAGLLGLGLLVAVRLERRMGGESRDGRIMLRLAIDTVFDLNDTSDILLPAIE